MTMDYDKLMRLAYKGALKSPDPSTQNGAVLVDETGYPYMQTLACNEFPVGVKYEESRWERPAKYGWIEHAERNCIFAAARRGIRTEAMTLVCPWAACSDCARAIIQVGIKTVVTHRPEPGATNERWDTSIAQAMTMLSEADVEVIYLDGKLGELDPIRRDGELWYP